MDHWDRLRQEVYDFAPSSWGWLQVLLETWPRPGEVPVALDYLEEHLSQRSLALSASGVRPQAPWWPLVSALDLEGRREDFEALAQHVPRRLGALTLHCLDANHIGALHDSGALEHLEHLSLHEYQSPGMLAWQELLGRPLPALAYISLLGAEENMLSALLALGQAAPQPRLSSLDMESMRVANQHQLLLGLARLTQHAALTELSLPPISDLRSRAFMFLDTELGQRIKHLRFCQTRADQVCGSLVDSPMPQLEALSVYLGGLDINLWSTWLEQKPNQLKRLTLHKEALDAATAVEPHWSRALADAMATQMEALTLTGYPLGQAAQRALWGHRSWPHLERLHIQPFQPHAHPWLAKLRAPALRHLSVHNLPDTRALLPLLAQPLPIQSFQLGSTPTDPAFWEALASSPWWEQLDTLYLDAAHLDDANLEALLRATPRRLTRLTLVNAAFTEASLSRLQEAGWLQGLKLLSLPRSRGLTCGPALEATLQKLDAPALTGLNLNLELLRQAGLPLVRAALPPRVKLQLLGAMSLEAQDRVAQGVGAALTQGSAKALGFQRGLVLEAGPLGEDFFQAQRDRAWLLAAHLLGAGDI